MPHEISPADFDLIVVGTGLQESLLAAGASRAGKKVLHIDTADFYGSHWASHQLGFFERWCKQHASETGPLYKNAEVYKASDAELGPSNEYNIDLAPKLVYSSGRLIDALLGGAAQNYLEFKLLQQSYVWKDGQFWQVPASRADVFKDSSLTPPEKRLLMRFLQKLQQYAMQEAGEAAPKLDARAFVDVLEAEKLPPQLQDIILYALAFATAAQPVHGRQPSSTEAAREGQGLPQSASTAGARSAATAKRQPQTESGDESVADAYSSNHPAQQCAQAASGSNPQASFSQDCLSSREDASQREIPSQQANRPAAAISSRGLMTHAEGMESLAQYMRSAGRYGTGTGAFLLPVYGGGELPQAFCRVAAVAGATYVLRQGIREFVVDEDTGRCNALVTDSGQELKAAAFAGNPEALSQFSRCQQGAAPEEGLSRAVLILDAPLVQGMSQVLVVMRPGAVGNAHPVRALQLGEAVACAPRDRYILHLSTLQAAATARADLQRAAQALADLSCLIAVSSSSIGVAPGTSHPCPSPSSSTADSGVQREQDSSAVGETSARPTGADVDTSEMKASRRPRALFLAYYNQALQEHLSGCWSLPQNVALCKLPDASAAYEECVREAEKRLQQLFPDVHHLFTERSAVDDDSDDEAILALSEALEGLPAADQGTA